MTAPPSRYSRIAHKILDQVEAAFDQLEDGLWPLEARDNALRMALLREASDIMGLSRVCVNKACRRAGKCRRQPSHCVGCYAPLVSPEVRAGVAPTLRARWRPRAIGPKIAG
jgi:hypothetical protein